MKWDNDAVANNDAEQEKMNERSFKQQTRMEIKMPWNYLEDRERESKEKISYNYNDNHEPKWNIQAKQR